MNSLVSVIIPAFNAEEFIAQTLESVTAQTHRNLEIIVVDDGSTDQTIEIVQDYIQRDNRVTLIRQSNSGVAAARNTGIEKSHGEFVAPIDADDVWFPENIEKQLELFADPEVGMVYSWSISIDQNGKLLKGVYCSLWEGTDYLPLVYRNCIGNASCVLIKRSCIDVVGGYDPSYRAMNAQGSEDWDLYLRIAENYKVKVVPYILVGYRQRLDSMSCNVDSMWRSGEEVLNRFSKRHPEIDPNVYRWRRGNFSLYLARKCSGAGNHQEALQYLFQAIRLDYYPILRRRNLRFTLFACLRFLLQPISMRIWPEQQDWLAFKEKWQQVIDRLIDLSKRDIDWREIKSYNIPEVRNLRSQRTHEELIARRFRRLQEKTLS